MLRALGIVTDNIDSGRQIGIAADRYCGGSVLRQIGTAAERYCSRSVRRPGSAQRGKKKEMSHEEKKSNEK